MAELQPWGGEVKLPRLLRWLLRRPAPSDTRERMHERRQPQYPTCRCWRTLIGPSSAPGRRGIRATGGPSTTCCAEGAETRKRRRLSSPSWWPRAFGGLRRARAQGAARGDGEARPALCPSSSARAGSSTIGGGRSLFLDCVGSGTPTVVLEAGLGGDSYNWHEVQRRLGRTTRTCAYDRAGLGNSVGSRASTTHA